jgi:hypothetical protein
MARASGDTVFRRRVLRVVTWEVEASVIERFGGVGQETARSGQ